MGALFTLWVSLRNFDISSFVTSSWSTDSQRFSLQCESDDSSINSTSATVLAERFSFASLCLKPDATTSVDLNLDLDVQVKRLWTPH